MKPQAFSQQNFETEGVERISAPATPQPCCLIITPNFPERDTNRRFFCHVKDFIHTRLTDVESGLHQWYKGYNNTIECSHAEILCAVYQIRRCSVQQLSPVAPSHFSFSSVTPSHIGYHCCKYTTFLFSHWSKNPLKISLKGLPHSLLN